MPVGNGSTRMRSFLLFLPALHPSLGIVPRCGLSLTQVALFTLPCSACPVSRAVYIGHSAEPLVRSLLPAPGVDIPSRRSRAALLGDTSCRPSSAPRLTRVILALSHPCPFASCPSSFSITALAASLRPRSCESCYWAPVRLPSRAHTLFAGSEKMMQSTHQDSQYSRLVTFVPLLNFHQFRPRPASKAVERTQR